MRARGRGASADRVGGPRQVEVVVGGRLELGREQLERGDILALQRRKLAALGERTKQQCRPQADRRPRPTRGLDPRARKGHPEPRRTGLEPVPRAGRAGERASGVIAMSVA